MSKHTPGQWAYHTWGVSSGRQFRIETADHRHGIASIAPNVTASSGITMEQHEANARLIASAPELLEALELSIDALRERAEGYGDPYHKDDLRRALAVISKAKGE